MSPKTNNLWIVLNKTLNNKYYLSIIFIFCIVSCGLISLNNGKDANWDLFNYHYYNGWAFLHNKSWENIIPAQLQSFFNPELDSVQYYLMTNLKPQYVGFIIGSFQGLNIFAIFLICRLLFNQEKSLSYDVVALIAGVSGIYYGPVSVTEIGSTMGDLTLSVLVIYGIYLLMKSVQEENINKSSREIFVAGVCLGAASGLKYTMGTYAVAAAISILIFPPPSLKRFHSILYLFFSGTISFFMFSGYWMFELYKEYNNPMFPFFNYFFRSPYMKNIDWSDATFKFKHLYDILLFPFSLLLYRSHHLQFSFRDAFLPLAFLSAIIYLSILSYNFLNKNSILLKDKAKNWIVLYFLMSYFVWAKVFGDYRYFISSEIICPIIILILLYEIIKSKKYRFILSTTILFGACLFLYTGSWGRLSWKSNSYFSIKIPNVYDKKNQTVLITGYQGVSFVVPFFNKDNKFIRIQSNFGGLESKKFVIMIHSVIKNQKGPFIVLTTFPEISKSHKILKKYNFVIDKPTCLPLKSIYTPEIVLCKLSKT